MRMTGSSNATPREKKTKKVRTPTFRRCGCMIDPLLAKSTEIRTIRIKRIYKYSYWKSQELGSNSVEFLFHFFQKRSDWRDYLFPARSITSTIHMHSNPNGITSHSPAVGGVAAPPLPWVYDAVKIINPNGVASIPNKPIIPFKVMFPKNLSEFVLK